ncbi:MAG: hypothetical protein PHG65_07995 [Kiritimatiellae bacterium]|nr:hypothetical protein [Kiritimatiellia bacterium]
MKWKTTGIALLVAGVAFMLAALGFPESIREDQPMVESAQARENMQEHATTQPAGPWEKAEQASSQARYDEDLILRAEHVLAFGILLFAAGGACLVVHTTRSPNPKIS